MRNRWWWMAALALACVAGVSGHARACSQCLCGSPAPLQDLLGGASGTWSYGFEERYLSKANGLDGVPGEERQYEHRLAGLIAWRPVPRASLQARLPYVIKKNTEAAAGEPEVFTRSHGIGDAEVLGRYDILRFGNLFTRRGTAALTGAVTIPTGSNDRRDDSGERLDAHLQPGTGAWSGSAGLILERAHPTTAMSASLLGRVNGTNAHGYHYGDAVLYNLGLARTLSPVWQGAVEVNGRTAARDRTEDGEHDPNSGGSIVYLAPSVRWGGLGSAWIDLLVQVPVIQALEGDQTEKTTARVSLIWAPGLGR